MPTAVCTACTAPYQPTGSRQVYCTRACARAAKCAQERQRWADDPERQRAKQRAKYARKRMQRVAADLAHWTPHQPPLALMPPPLDMRRLCSLCGAVDPVCGFGMKGSNWCRDCKRAHDRAYRQAVDGRRAPRFTAGRCAECSTPFVAEATGARFCSIKCAAREPRRRRKQTRRAQLRSVPTEPVSLSVVAERDGWRCHICKRKVARTTWSLDHLVPLSMGGSHTYLNVALAHHRCNSLRSNTGAAQLLLVS